jgi:hypothetical protein
VTPRFRFGSWTGVTRRDGRGIAHKPSCGHSHPGSSTATDLVPAVAVRENPSALPRTHNRPSSPVVPHCRPSIAIVALTGSFVPASRVRTR